MLDENPGLWAEAVSHPFLDQCADGSIRPSQFNTWLVQDYLFVIDFTRLLARTLAAAPVAHFGVLLGGLQAIDDELEWFRVKAGERELNLDAARHPACETYCGLMDQWSRGPYAVRATALWTIERAYNQGWQEAGRMTPPYHEFAERWGNAAFSEYVTELERQADQALAEAPESVRREAAEVFREVARQEKAFWQMAYSGSS